MASQQESSQSSTMEATPSKRRRWKRLALGSLLLGLVGTTGAGGMATWSMRSSLPLLDGSVHEASLESRVTVDRDGSGVPTIRSSSRTDTAYALGFLHAQDRFFQMDLLRRLSGGRLGELVGRPALDSDRRHRKHRFQALAEQVVANLPDTHRSILEAYARGVNSGLSHLRAYPFEYVVLGQAPTQWKETDSLLVMMTMLCDLQPMDAQPEMGLSVLAESVPQDVFQFLVRPSSQWDAALDDSMYPAPSIPPESSFSLRARTLNPKPVVAESDVQEPPTLAIDPRSIPDFEFRVGSNNWAVGGNVGRDGRAILASDMHLGLRVPTIWYRAMMQSPTIDGTPRRLIGVTLPGAPILVEGSNGSIAWGFTNSTGDFGDVVVLQAVDHDAGQYATPRGPKPLTRFTEEIRFPDGSVDYTYEWSDWGPVIEERGGHKLVHRWIGHDASAFDLHLLEMESAKDVVQAMSVANRAGMPNQNVMIADDQGNIGWTLSGRIPRRVGPPPVTSVDWSKGGEWLGYLSPEEYPRVMNPESGRLWTANNRIMGDTFLNTVGDGRYDPGARARQIRDRLNEKDVHDEKSLLDIQLDDEARFLRGWKERLLKVCDVSKQPVSDEFLQHVRRSSDRASTEAVGYRIVHEFRAQVMKCIFGFEGGRRSASRTPELRGLAAAIESRIYIPLSFEDVVQQLLTEQPLYWLPGEFSSWDELLVHAAKETELELTRQQPLSDARWGIRNRAAIQHPLASAVPSLGGLLNMQALELAGDNHMPRVQSPSGGASERLVVSPGQEELGIYHQPGGQSGHPLSPFYATGYEDWVYGRPSSLMPGPARHQLLLIPKRTKGAAGELRSKTKDPLSAP